MVYNDVLQHDFVDSFANLTLKTTFMLKWILNNNCSSAKFIFKVIRAIALIYDVVKHDIFCTVVKDFQS